MPTVLQPPSRRNASGLGWCAFARHYLRNHFCFLFLRVLRCFSSPGSPPLSRMMRIAPHRVAPFGNPCLNGYLPLNTAYRSLSRPSSPPRAKASFMCPFLLSVVLQGVPVCMSCFCAAAARGSPLRQSADLLVVFVFTFQYVNVLFSVVVPGRVELPTSTLSV